MIGVEAFPAFIYTILIFTVPKSPRWLISKNRNEEAKAVLDIINPIGNSEKLMLEIKTESESHTEGENIFMKKISFSTYFSFFNSHV